MQEPRGRASKLADMFDEQEFNDIVEAALERSVNPIELIRSAVLADLAR